LYKIVTIEDVVRVPPDRFGEPLEKVIEEILKKGYEHRGGTVGGYAGIADKDIGVVLSIVSVDEIGDGRIIPNDGASYRKVSFKALICKPELHEVVDCEVVDVVEFGAFVRLGAVDGLIHISQVTDDYIAYDEKRQALIGKETSRTLQVGDKVRARIVAVSTKSEGGKEGKINLTMRQNGLGKFEWIKEDKEEEKKPGEKKTAEKKEEKEKPEKKAGKAESKK